MKIAYLLTSLGVGGAERQVISLAESMKRRGHTVMILSLRARPVHATPSELEVTYLDVRRSLTSSARGFFRAAGKLRSFRPDILHGHNFHGNIMARLLGITLPRCKVVSTIHNVYEGGRVRMLAYRMTDRLAHVVTAVCTAAAERYIHLHAVRASHCRVLHNGINADAFVPDKAARALMRTEMGVGPEFVWIAIGRNTQAKDFPNILQAFGQVSSGDPSARLWIVGGASVEDGKKSFGGFTMPHGSIDRVWRLGLRSDVASLLNAADGFVLGSAWEGMPLALGEAMAMEKPVVATDVGGVRELCGEQGIVVPAKNSDALAAAMKQVMQLPEAQRERIGREARERMLSSFAMSEKACEWESLYERMCPKE